MPESIRSGASVGTAHLVVPKLIAIGLTLFVLTLSASSCVPIQERMDYYGLEGNVRSLLEHYNPGRPEDLMAYLDGTTLEESLSPIDLSEISVSPLDRWLIKHPLGYTLIQEKITFPSQVREGMPRVNRATFYLYRRGSLKGRKVMISVPGLGVSDWVLYLVGCYFDEILKRDYDVLFYVPPFHLDRKEDGKGDGEGFFTSNTVENLSVIYSSAREIRTAIDYLKKEGVASIGGRGGSMGASILLLLSTAVEFDHISVGTPIVNWRTVTMDNGAMKPLRAKLNESGFSDELLYEAYDRISPINYKSIVSPDRIALSYAEYDQLTPSATVKAFAEKWNISRIRSYDRSHTTVLLNFRGCADYNESLDYLDNRRPK
jgi:hypothetical protein